MAINYTLGGEISTCTNVKLPKFANTWTIIIKPSLRQTWTNKMPSKWPMLAGPHMVNWPKFWSFFPFINSYARNARKIENVNLVLLGFLHWPSLFLLLIALAYKIAFLVSRSFWIHHNLSQVTRKWHTLVNHALC